MVFSSAATFRISEKCTMQSDWNKCWIVAASGKFVECRMRGSEWNTQINWITLSVPLKLRFSMFVMAGNMHGERDYIPLTVDYFYGWFSTFRTNNNYRQIQFTHCSAVCVSLILNSCRWFSSHVNFCTQIVLLTLSWCTSKHDNSFSYWNDWKFPMAKRQTIHFESISFLRWKRDLYFVVAWQ